MTTLSALPVVNLHLAILFFSMITSQLQQSHAAGNDTDRLALLEFKQAITTDSHGVFNSWNHSFHFCNWFGVSCGRRHQRVVSLVLNGHNLKGSVSPYIGNLSFLRTLDLQNNSFHGRIPSEIGNLFRLELFLLNNNSLRGEIPSSLSNCSKLQKISLRLNNLSGKIPGELGSLTNLESLSLVVGNQFQGDLPDNISLPNILEITISGNNFSGSIPSSLSNASRLEVIDISENNFVGHVPRKQRKSNPVAPFLSTGPHLEVSYRDLHQATSGFSSDHLIGSGSFGFVYKGYLDKEKISVAIKVLKLEETGALKSFMAECKALRSVRHRNLVKLLTYCLSLDYKGNEFKALIFEFMENGSLEKWLDHDNEVNNQGRNLNFLQRLNIAIDIASALHYLHDLCETLIIHRDLKPSNILLDDNFVARLSDFGLAKLFFSINDESQSQMSSIGVKGTIGYAPPEYGMGGMASKEGDVYSFGILVLELFSGKKPIDQMFENGLNLHGFVKNGMSQAVWTVVDPTILSEETEEAQNRRNRNPGRAGSDKKECLLSVFRIGVECSMENPKERMKMGDVVKELHLIRSAFLGVRIYG
ncbi:LRR receptor-like serine/threonine-protein kinase EFR [Euphorbia lathyris]|uniref:LRR receptor-like serine/threonine-protein kinase EFR n=1 Tax=Euphorbia lathyris TaxID=212925 RepID=UPI00331338BA